jgi:ATP-dependent DNA helicase RecG
MGPVMIKILSSEKRLNMSIRYVKGVGEKRLTHLLSLGISTVEDALLFLPRRYEDRTVIKKISECKPEDNCTVIARLVSDIQTKTYKANRSLVRAVFRDETGRLPVVWFNAPYIKNKLKRDQEYSLYGRIGSSLEGISMSNPIMSDAGSEPEIIPVYPLTKNIKQHEIRRIVQKGIEIYQGKLLETLPAEVLSKRGLVDINTSVIDIHHPKNMYELEKARKRLAYEELFYLQLSLLSIKTKNQSALKNRKYAANEMIYEFIGRLPFELTKAQKKVLKEIFDDLDSPKVMNRLLQGDVGSGKTIIALLCALKAFRAGMQTAVMVPTSILAIQHFETFTELLKGMDINIGLLYSAVKGNEKKELIEKTKQGKIDILIGTHSLIQDNIGFSNLGLVITDEQHRFGVDQRFRFISKGEEPDKLVLTATPIPRTLALIIYGDTDISILDELPPGRKKTETYAVDETKRKRLYGFVLKNIKEGRQVYIICPMIEDSEMVEAQSVVEYTKKIKDQFPGFRIASLHGKMKSDEKENTLFEFTRGNIDILISTTVIEIGINVPNANIILIENAERYGLAQLHQLRGRVGRGEHQSYCILMSDTKNELTRKRIEVLVSSTDGFYISEMDLKLRGPGDFFGTMQHGIPEMKAANLYEDMELMLNAQEDIKQLVSGDIAISSEEKSIMDEICSEMREDMINA